MDLTMNLLFSTLEFASLFVLMFALFRIQLNGFYPHLIFSSILLALISYLFYEVFKIPLYAPILQSIICIGFLWLMFRIHLFYSCIIVTMGYLSYIFLQVIFVILFHWTGLGSKQQIMGEHTITYLFQATCSILVFVLCYLLFRYRLGFSFVPDDERQKISLNGLNSKLLITVFFAGVIISIFYFSSLHGFSTFAFVSFLLVLVILSMILLAVRKDLDS